jgi:hypothetical protein
VSDDELTPVDRKSTLEMILERIEEVGTDAKLAVTEAREAKGHAQNTYNLQVGLNQRFNGMERRLAVVEFTRAWPAVVAVAALILAVFALIRTW